jgi:hypothetical protein
MMYDHIKEAKYWMLGAITFVLYQCIILQIQDRIPKECFEVFRPNTCLVCANTFVNVMKSFQILLSWNQQYLPCLGYFLPDILKIVCFACLIF